MECTLINVLHLFGQLTGNIMDGSETLKVALDNIATQLSTIIQGNVHNLSRYSNYEKEN